MIRRIGNRLILIGVAHVLPQSIEEVKNRIKKEKPNVVGVELCRSRYLSLTTKGRKSGEMSVGSSRVSLLAKILGYFQEKMGQQTGVFPGEEMLTAIQGAQSIGSEVKLIDREINFTFQRLMAKMSFWEKLKILSEVLFSFLWFRKDFDLEDLTEEEVVEELLSTFEDLSETAYEVLIEERNEYMADKITDLLRSRSGKILCVVGAGHVPGLSEKLESRFENGTFEPWKSYQTEWEI